MPVLALGFVLGGCMSGLLPGSTSEPSAPSAPSGGSALANLMRFGTTSPPPPMQPVEEEIECPSVVIVPGGAALRIGGGDSESVRSQITLTDVARECAGTAGGPVTMRVGAEGRVLVGPAGSAGPMGATLRIEVRRADTVIASRNVRVGATIPAGEAQATWTHVESGIVVPAEAFKAGGDIDVFLTLNPGGATPRRARR